MHAWTKTTTVAHGQTVDIVHRTKVTWKLIARRVVKNVDCCKRAVDLENQILWIKPWVRCLIGHCSLISVKNLHITLRCISAAHRWKTIVSRQSPCYANMPHPPPLPIPANTGTKAAPHNNFYFSNSTLEHFSFTGTHHM